MGFKGRPLLISNYQVVEERNLQQFPCLDGQLSHPNVLRRWVRAVAARMAVGEDDGWCVLLDRVHKEFRDANMNGIHRPFVHEHVLGDLIHVILQQNVQLFLP